MPKELTQADHETITELKLKDLDPANEAHVAMVGAITRLRVERRELSAKLETAQSERERAIEALKTDYEGKLQQTTGQLETYRVKERRGAVIAEALTGRKATDPEKLNKWAEQLSTGEGWEEKVKELVTDLSVPIETTGATTETQRPVTTTGTTTTGAAERVAGTEIKYGPTDFVAKLQLGATDPEAFEKMVRR